MMLVAIENFVLFCTLLALISFALATLVRSLVRRGLLNLHPNTLSRFYGATVIIPPALSVWLVGAALLPELWLGEGRFNASHPQPLHELHLLGDLTGSLEPTLAYFALSFTVAAALFAAWSSVHNYLRISSVVERLEMNAAPPPAEKLSLAERLAAARGLKVGLVMSDYPFSFVWGFHRSKLVLSSGLFHTLTPEELSGVLEHEAAHHARRDNLTKLVLAICSYASPVFPLTRFILRWRAGQVEMVCDEVAAAYTHGPLEIAEALVKLRRQTRCPGSNVKALVSSFTPDDTPEFEKRVRRVVSLTETLPTLEQAQSLYRHSRSKALLTVISVLGVGIAFLVLSPLAVHRVAESLIQLVK